jgi:hypothetical protein
VPEHEGVWESPTPPHGPAERDEDVRERSEADAARAAESTAGRSEESEGATERRDDATSGPTSGAPAH